MRFQRALAGEPSPVPPIWLMRQAGRYHSHYQRLRASHTFETLCRTPELAAEVALGPIDAFDFDAAILFSDLLFPLDAFGMHVSYDQGRPEVDGRLTLERLDSFYPLEEALSRLSFQRDAVVATRARLPPSKGLIGFIGGPWTLFEYAAGPRAIYDAFASRMVPLLIECAREQLQAGADIVMMFDTAAGSLPRDVFAGGIARDIRAIASAHPHKIGYFARDLTDAHENAAGFETIPLAGRGIDMQRNLAAELRNRKGGLPFIHGNFDPRALQLSGDSLEQALDRFLAPVRRLDVETRRGWMCGLGHGVLPGTPEDSVRTFVNVVRETFS